MKYCRECGNPVEEGNKFCKNCGTEIKTPNTENTQSKYTVKQDTNTSKIQNIEQKTQIPQKESKAKIYLAIMAIIIILLVGAGIILSSFAPTEATYNGQYISFNYPPEYTIEQADSEYLEDILIYANNGDYVGTIYVWKTNEKTTLDDDLEALKALNYSNPNVQYVNFAGFSNVIEETGQYEDGDNYKGYLIQDNGINIQISLVSDMNGIDTIINSFKASI